MKWKFSALSVSFCSTSNLQEIRLNELFKLFLRYEVIRNIRKELWGQLELCTFSYQVRNGNCVIGE